MEPPSSRFIYLIPFDAGDRICVIITIILLILSALLSCALSAFFTLSGGDGEKKRDKTAELLKHHRYYLSNIIVARNFAVIATVLLIGFVVSSSVRFSSDALQFCVAVLGPAVVLLSACLPAKLIAVRYPEQVITGTAGLVKAVCAVSKPFASKKTPDKNIAGKKDSDELPGEPEDKSALKAILEASNTEVKKILQPRIDVTAVDISADFTALCDFAVECAYSRIPVYEGNFDNIKGILYVKDLFPHIRTAGNDFEWQQLVHEAYFVPETKRINDLLDEFQQKKVHMAIVVDEYGGTAGIVTLEDILEEMVGDIMDESDVESDEQLFFRLKDGAYLFEGKTPLNDFYKILQTDNELFDDIKGDAETLAGLVLEMKGEFPEQGEEMNIKNFNFKIEQIDNRRINRIKVTPLA